MKLIRTKIPEVVVIEPAVFEDPRGWFMESFNEQRFQSELASLGLSVPRPFVQDNHSSSKKGVLRGLHYQLAPRAQGKLVRVTQGSVFDVAVDLRASSATYGEWVGIILSAADRRQLWIPEGFGHGFVTLTDTAEFLYKTTDYYSREHERCIRWNDPSLDIRWPFDGEPSLSDKDLQGAALIGADVFA